MTEREIAERVLTLLSKTWGDPEAHQGFRDLLGQVSGKAPWREIIAARLMALEGKTEEAIAALRTVLASEPRNFFAAIILGSILCYNAKRAKEAIDVYDSVLQTGFKALPDPDLAEALTLLKKGVALGEMGRNEQAIQVYDRVEERFGGATEPGIREQVARALINKGAALGKMERYDEAIQVYKAVEKRFGGATEPGIREQVAKAMVNKGWTLGQMGRHEEKILVCTEVENRFGEATEPGIRELVAKAMVNKGWALVQMGNYEEAIQVYDEVEDGFGKETQPRIREIVAGALVNKAAALGKMGRPQEATLVCDEVENRFGNQNEARFRELIAKALLNRGAAFVAMGRNEEAIQVCSEVENRFGKDTEPGIREIVAGALLNRGAVFVAMGRNEEAIQVCSEVESRFGKDTEPGIREQVARVLLYKTGLLLSSDKNQEAKEVFERLEHDFTSSDQAGSEKMKAAIGQHFPYIRSLMKATAELAEGTWGKGQSQIEPDEVPPTLKGYLEAVLKEFDRKTLKDYFEKMDETKALIDQFIKDPSRMVPDASFILVLREWNSYTPAIPAHDEADRGGGYFIRHGRQGIVIDPGYDFIQNFFRAGGLLCDIDHVIVTHAHDDHTAELERLLMLLHRRWEDEKGALDSRVSLYLSAGAARKFAGLVDPRDPKFRRVVTMFPGDHDSEQRFALNDDTTLTVLPAYHDDVITRDSAVGLGFEFSIGEDFRRVVFTSDSGLYPITEGQEGEEKKKAVNVVGTQPLFKLYPERFIKPDLLVAHIGSIKKREFEPPARLKALEDEALFYYPNHLGILGTLTMLHQLSPRAAVISEFGSELKRIRFDLIEKLAKVLHRFQPVAAPGEEKTFVIPGDLTIVYDITERRFLCHETCRFRDPKDLFCREASDCNVNWNSASKRCKAEARKDASRTYLFLKKNSASKKDEYYSRKAEDYFEKLAQGRLPYHWKK